VLLAACALPACSALPAPDHSPMPIPVAAAPDAPLARAAREVAQRHPGLSGIHSLGAGLDAFAARMALIDAAQSTLDVQYYIWRTDLTGRLLFDALRRAADRGVRVRLLLDDNNTGGMDRLLAALDAHPRVEVRLFNPFRQRRLRPVGYLTEFGRLNRRMHNKSLTADGVATIVGGRNVGDEYFDARTDLGFLDLDVLAVGSVVPAVAESFGQYWNSASSYPASALLAPADAADLRLLERLGADTSADPAAAPYVAAVADARFLRDLRAGELALEWAAARLVVDDPAKGLGRAAESDLLLGRLESAVGAPLRRELAIVSPYFVPGPRGAAILEGYARAGLRVRILTNALESTDVAAVHSGYVRYRKRLLQAGVELFELRRGAREPAPHAGSGGFAGSSGASLHAKTFALDAERIFVGSFNFDPRSARLNTEMGLVVDSPAMAQALSGAFDDIIPRSSYRPVLDPRGRLEWLEQAPDGSVRRHDREPGTTLARRFSVGFLALLPIEGLL
jgi:putative cardiolipin synthase